VLAAVREEGRDLATVAGALSLYPQRLINVPVRRGFDWERNAAIAQARTAAEHRLGKAGRLLLRASGTEPLIRVTVEAADALLMQSGLDTLADAVRAAG